MHKIKLKSLSHFVVVLAFADAIIKAGGEMKPNGDALVFDVDDRSFSLWFKDGVYRSKIEFPSGKCKTLKDENLVRILRELGSNMTPSLAVRNFFDRIEEYIEDNFTTEKLRAIGPKIGGVGKLKKNTLGNKKDSISISTLPLMRSKLGLPEIGIDLRDKTLVQFQFCETEEFEKGLMLGKVEDALLADFWSLYKQIYMLAIMSFDMEDIIVAEISLTKSNLVSDWF